LVRAQVHDIVDVLQGRAKVIPIGRTADQYFGILGQVIGSALRMDSGLQAVQDADVIASGEKRIHRVGSDEAGSPRYQHPAEAHRPVPRATATTVAARIFKSSQMDQVST